VHEFPTRSPPTLIAETCDSLRFHHHSNMPGPAVYVVVAVIGAVATGYAIKEVRLYPLVPTLAVHRFTPGALTH